MTEPRRHSVAANGIKLNVYQFGNQRGEASPAGKPPVVMLHGMRDVGLSLASIAEAIAAHHTVYLMDLRGHGASDKPGGYAMVQFVYDLHAVLTSLVETPAVLFGHSLGGHIVCRVAALFPELVLGTIVVEGLGPPGGREPEDPAQALAMEGERIVGTLSIPETQRPLPDLNFAAQRLMANNPRLPADRAQRLARQGTTTRADGELIWNFDPRVQTVFVGSDTDRNERYWCQIRCPSCIITGDQAGEYWRRAMPAGSSWSGNWAAGELSARAALFPDAELATLSGSGHMVHFDEPERLADITLDFLRRRL